LEIRRVAFTYHAQPVEWRVTHVHTKNYQYLA
jgi:GntR family transcriptional regulator